MRLQSFEPGSSIPLALEETHLSHSPLYLREIDQKFIDRIGRRLIRGQRGILRIQELDDVHLPSGILIHD